MKNLVLLFSIILSSFMNAQSNRFIYELKSVRDTISKNVFSSIMYLDVNKNDVKFFPKELYEVDSTQKATKKYNSGMSLSNSLIIKRIKNHPENENYVFGDTDYYKYKTIDIIKWEISPETKTKKNYTLQKATTNFGGRNWTAWFAKEIPINQGPYKFQGLPGLIFQIEDERKNYSFSLIEIQKLNEEYDTGRIIESNFGKKPLPITLEKYNEILLNAYNNPYSEIRTKLEKGEDYTFSAYGKQIKSTKDLDEVRKIIQQTKRKNHNPIELNKAVNYTD